MRYVLITQRVELYPDIHERRDALSQEWAFLAESCDFVPILAPNHVATAEKLLEGLPISGIILSGGNNLVSYGGDAPERDEVERFLIECAIKKKIPLLGVCRGMQMLMDYFGMPLVPVEHHIRTTHALNNGDIVNSFHSLGAMRCFPPLMATCYSYDGIVEGIEHTSFNWIRGIMWHPERYNPIRERDISMIKELFGL